MGIRSLFLCAFYGIGIAVAHGQDRPYVPALPNIDYIYPQNGALIGQGWDSFNQHATSSSCVDVAEERLEKSSFETSVEQIKSTYSLVTKIGASASVGYGGFGFKASGNLAVSSTASINSDNQNFIFTFLSSDGSTFAVPQGQTAEPSDSVVKLLGTLKSDAAQQNYLAHLWAQPRFRYSGQIKLTQAAADLWDKDKKSFDRECGDGFVSAIHRGARINLLLSQQSSSLDAANSLAASLSASGFGMTGSASYSTNTQQLNTTDGLSYRVFQEGGIPLKPSALPRLAAGQFFDVNNILPSTDQLVASPVAFSVTVTPYENIVKDADKGSIATPLRLLTLSDYYIVLTDEYNLVQNILTEVRSTPSSPSFPFDQRLIAIYGGENALEGLSDDIHSDLAFLESAISQCYSEARACTVPLAVRGAKKDFSQMLVQAEEILAQDATILADAQSHLASLKVTSKPEDSVEISRLTSKVDDLSLGDKKISQATRRLKDIDSLTTSGGGIDPYFFLRFYRYLALTPLPKAAYSGADFAALQQLSFLTAVPADKENKLKASNDALKRAMLAFRLTPWKRFFCNTLRSSMCVTESKLQDILSAALPTINGKDLTPIIPPPPKPAPDLAPHRFPSDEPRPCGVPPHGVIC